MIFHEMIFKHIFPLTCRVKIPSMNEEAFHLITSFLDSELKVEALLTLHGLVQHSSSPRSHVMASVVTPPLFTMLASEDTEGLELSLRILCELSFDDDIRSSLVSMGIISKLVPIFSEAAALSAVWRFYGTYVTWKKLHCVLQEPIGVLLLSHNIWT
jgi:hypothetical protein